MFKKLWQINEPLTVTGLIMLVALPLSILGIIVDPRIITAAPAWAKPAKFAVSIAIYVFTLLWIYTLIPEWRRTRSVVGWVTAVVMLLELAIIDLQAWRGTTSHFNNQTVFDTVLFGIMGSAIVTQTITSVAVAVALWRQRFADRALGWTARLGMTLTIIGAFTGGLMVRPTPAQLAAAHPGQPMAIVGAHTVGAPDGGPGLPGVGWSTAHGDLRVPHFLGLHALQALVLVMLLARRSRLSETARVRLTFTAAASYFALYVILLAQALRGDPMWSLHLPMIAAWAVLTAIAAGISIVRIQPATSHAAV